MKKQTQMALIAMLGVVALAAPALANPAQLIIWRGSVSAKKAQWSTFARARSGLSLGGADLVRPGPNARAALRCPDGRTPRLANNVVTSVNSKCNISRTIYRPGPLTIGDLQGGSDRALPYIIAPRTRGVLSATPRLQWNPVPGATTYRVSLEIRKSRRQPQPDAVVWTVESPKAEIAYPEGAAPLETGQFYRLVVVADTGASSEQVTVQNLSFLLRPQPDVAAELAAVDALELPPELITLAKAEILLEKQYLAGAIALLQAQIAREPTAALYQTLGNAYLASGLRLLAEATHQQAIAQADLYAELDVWLASQLALAQLYERVGQPQAAVQRLRQAELAALYWCDGVQLAEIGQRLAALGAVGDEAAAACPVPE